MTSILGRKSYARIPDVLTLPSLIEVQLESFEWLKTDGLAELFEAGYRMDVEAYRDFVPESCHQEVELATRKGI